MAQSESTTALVFNNQLHELHTPLHRCNVFNCMFAAKGTTLARLQLKELFPFSTKEAIRK
jgi:hypothetical protein